MKTNVWARRRARRALVQAVYQWQMNQTTASDLVEEFTSNGSLAKADVEFFESMLRGLTLGDEDVDALFTPFLDRKLEALDKVELAILRLGTFELKTRLDVPFRVVIDEYVELTKTFGAEDGHKYVNGILDRVARDIRTVEVS